MHVMMNHALNPDLRLAYFAEKLGVPPNVWSFLSEDGEPVTPSRIAQYYMTTLSLSKKRLAFDLDLMPAQAEHLVQLTTYKDIDAMAEWLRDPIKKGIAQGLLDSIILIPPLQVANLNASSGMVEIEKEKEQAILRIQLAHNFGIDSLRQWRFPELKDAGGECTRACTAREILNALRVCCGKTQATLAAESSSFSAGSVNYAFMRSTPESIANGAAILKPYIADAVRQGVLDKDSLHPRISPFMTPQIAEKLMLVLKDKTTREGKDATDDPHYNDINAFARKTKPYLMRAEGYKLLRECMASFGLTSSDTLAAYQQQEIQKHEEIYDYAIAAQAWMEYKAIPRSVLIDKHIFTSKDLASKWFNQAGRTAGFEKPQPIAEALGFKDSPGLPARNAMVKGALPLINLDYPAMRTGFKVLMREHNASYYHFSKFEDKAPFPCLTTNQLQSLRSFIERDEKPYRNGSLLPGFVTTHTLELAAQQMGMKDIFALEAFGKSVRPWVEFGLEDSVRKDSHGQWIIDQTANAATGRTAAQELERRMAEGARRLHEQDSHAAMEKQRRGAVIAQGDGRRK